MIVGFFYESTPKYLAFIPFFSFGFIVFEHPVTVTIIFDPVFESSVTVLNSNQCFPLSCCSELMVLIKGITIKKCARTLEAAHRHTCGC